MKKTVVLLTMAASLVPLHAGIQVSGQADIVSRYIWRGFDLYPENKPAFQPSLTFDFGNSGLSVEAWFSFASANRAEFKTADELNLIVSYALPAGDNVDLSAGLIHYVYYRTPGFTYRNDTSREVFVEAGLPNVFARPSLTVFYDFDLGDGLYAELSGALDAPLSENVVPELSVALGYNGRQYQKEKSGLSHLSWTLALPLEAKGVTITPFCNLTFIFLRAVNPSKSEIFFGLSVSF
ncbi:MAG: TorF family putative porin [Acidobacteriota bacterium]|nr:TorF family putative porin [Acidobacteriota bacterium]